MIQHRVCCRILCTQPRRISAVGVGTRVAQERVESIGGTVGYQIRLERKVTPETRLIYMTTGILLRRLAADPDLVGITHIIVDEVASLPVVSCCTGIQYTAESVLYRNTLLSLLCRSMSVLSGCCSRVYN